MGIFFTDLDGTLEDSRQDMAEAVLLTRKELKLPAGQVEAYLPHVNRGMSELYYNCFPDYLRTHVQLGMTASHGLELIRKKYEKVYLDGIANHTKLYPGVREMLHTISQKFKIVVVTNKPTKLSQVLLTKLDVAQYVSLVMGGDSCAETKPSPLPLRIAQEKLNLKSNENCFMLGDSVADIVAGTDFGAKTIWCSWGYLTDTQNLVPSVTARCAQDVVSFVMPR